MATSEGVLTNCYPSVFQVEHEETMANGKSVMRSSTYSYKDLLTKTVQITLL